MGRPEDERVQGDFASFLGSAASLGQQAGLDIPLMSRMPQAASMPFNSEKGVYDKELSVPQEKFRVKRFRIGPEDEECEPLNELLDNISNHDNWFLRNQREQIMNDGSIVVLVSYMIVEMVKKKKFKLAEEEDTKKKGKKGAPPPVKEEGAPEDRTADEDEDEDDDSSAEAD